MKDFPLNSVWHMYGCSSNQADWLTFVILSVHDNSRWCKVIASGEPNGLPCGYPFTFTTSMPFCDYCERLV